MRSDTKHDSSCVSTHAKRCRAILKPFAVNCQKLVVLATVHLRFPIAKSPAGSIRLSVKLLSPAPGKRLQCSTAFLFDPNSQFLLRSIQALLSRRTCFSMRRIGERKPRCNSQPHDQLFTPRLSSRTEVSFAQSQRHNTNLWVLVP